MIRCKVSVPAELETTKVGVPNAQVSTTPRTPYHLPMQCLLNIPSSPPRACKSENQSCTIYSSLPDPMYSDISNPFSAYLVKLSPTHRRTSFDLFAVSLPFLDSLYSLCAASKTAFPLPPESYGLLLLFVIGTSPFLSFI